MQNKLSQFTYITDHYISHRQLGIKLRKLHAFFNMTFLVFPFVNNKYNIELQLVGEHVL